MFPLKEALNYSYEINGQWWKQIGMNVRRLTFYQNSWNMATKVARFIAAKETSWADPEGGR